MNKHWIMINSSNIIARKLLTKTDFYGSIHLSKDLIKYFNDYEFKSNTEEKIHSLQFFGIMDYDFVYFEKDRLCFYPLVSDAYNSPLRKVAEEQFLYFFDELGKPRRPKKQDILPDDLKVYLELSCADECTTVTGELRRVFRFEIYRQEPIIPEEIFKNIERKYIKTIDHTYLENLINSNMNEDELIQILGTMDDSARIEESTAFLKTRRYKRWIIEDLKRIYEGKCQICGYSSYPEFNIQVSEAHHIDLFSKSLDNSPKNIIILCPNHHRILHLGNFHFSRENLHFYNAKSVLPIYLNKHL
ncbi:hypothetical protein D1872_168920 [compost metagenome]